MLTMLMDMLKYNHWANGQVIACVQTLQEPPSEMLRLMSHVLQTEIAGICRIEGRPLAEHPRDGFAPIAMGDMLSVNDRNHAAYIVLASGDLSRRIDYKLFSGASMQSMAGDMLRHVLVHGIHHRGQLATLGAANASQLGRPGFPNISHVAYAQAQGR